LFIYTVPKKFGSNIEKMSFYFDGKTVSAEDNDGVRGYSLQTNENLEDGEDEYFGYDRNNNNVSDEFVDEEGENDKAPVMSSEFYDQVETFLRREPPKIGDSMKDGKSNKKKKKDGIADSDYPAQEFTQIPTLPPVNLPKRQAESINEAKPYRKKASDASSKKHKYIDSQLLKEAFAYTDDLLRNAVLEEAAAYQLENNDHHGRGMKKPAGAASQKERKTHSAPAAEAAGDREYLFYGAPTGKGKNAPVNIVRSLKSKKKQGGGGGSGGGRPVHADDFFVKKEDEVDLKRNPLNFEELVANFQQGITLERLRQELAESNKSLKQSNSAIRNIMRK
jgi:uncharacterized spore protein YtfJ